MGREGQARARRGPRPAGLRRVHRAEGALMPAQVVVLGGGVGGTLAANLLNKALGRDATVTVVDGTGMHVYQPGFLYVALGQANALWLARDERTLLRKGVELVIDQATKIDPTTQTVQLAHSGSIAYDYLVLATGSRLNREAVPGYGDSHDFYSLEGALRLREELRRFKGGKILLGVAGIPYKSSVTLLSPLNRAFTIESASKLVQPIFDKRGIGLSTFFNVESVDSQKRIVNSLEGESADYDLLVLVPPHRGAAVVEASGLGDTGGWVPTDRNTLQHKEHERIFTLGDATDLPISKSGSTAHFEAPVIASRIASLVRGTAPKTAYGGRVMCFLETGAGRATSLRFDYAHPPVPPKPSRLWHWAKWVFNRAYWVTVPQGRVG